MKQSTVKTPIDKAAEKWFAYQMASKVKILVFKDEKTEKESIFISLDPIMINTAQSELELAYKNAEKVVYELIDTHILQTGLYREDISVIRNKLKEKLDELYK